FWFCQISPQDEKRKPGGPISKRAVPLEKPADIGPAQLVAASGRLYHHMKEDPQSSIVPDSSYNYGAYMNLILFDKKSKGNGMRLDVAAGVEIREDGNYIIEFDGNIQLGSPNPKVLEIDENAMASGALKIRYNSAEEHFLGQGSVLIRKEALCAKGNLLVDIRPGEWHVAIGSREQMIMITPGCTGWGGAGWIDVTQNIAEVGLGISFSVNVKFGVDLKAVSANVYIDAGAAAGIQAKAQYKPKLVLLEAGLWLDIWAKVIADYNLKLLDKRGSCTLVDVYCRGDMIVVFNPPPTLVRGRVSGYLKVLGVFSCDFDTGFEKVL
ncbi:MAG TPA: hypothetical protein VIK89_03675, partial [Cytophagaceae bacterium]